MIILNKQSWINLTFFSVGGTGAWVAMNPIDLLTGSKLRPNDCCEDNFIIEYDNCDLKI